MIVPVMGIEAMTVITAVMLLLAGMKWSPTDYDIVIKIAYFVMCVWTTANAVVMIWFNGLQHVS